MRLKRGREFQSPRKKEKHRTSKTLILHKLHNGGILAPAPVHHFVSTGMHKQLREQASNFREEGGDILSIHTINQGQEIVRPQQKKRNCPWCEKGAYSIPRRWR